MAPAWIALLRAVNLGPHNKVPMAELRDALTALGFAGVRTLLASGNAVFEAQADAADLEARIEAALAERFGLKTDVLVRSPEDWAKMIADNPFDDVARDDPSHLVVMPLKGQPSAEQVQALQTAIPGREKAEVRGSTCYLTYPDGIGQSKLTAALIDRKLGVRGTGRNWNTVLKLATAVGSPHHPSP